MNTEEHKRITREEYANWPFADYEEFIGDSGHMLIYNAFLEMATDKSKVRYTLRMKAHHGHPSAYQIIANAKDEYDAAMKLCGEWHIWLRWKDSKALWTGERHPTKVTGIRDALAAMDARRTGEAMANIISRSEDGDYRASKDLVTWGLPKKKTGKKVTEVVEESRDNIFAIAGAIAKEKKA